MSAAIDARTAIRSPGPLSSPGSFRGAARGRSRPVPKRGSERSQDEGDWLADSGRRQAVVVALNLLPFAGIAFLWFIGVVAIGSGRGRIGSSRRCSLAADCCSSP